MVTLKYIFLTGFTHLVKLDLAKHFLYTHFYSFRLIAILYKIFNNTFPNVHCNVVICQNSFDKCNTYTYYKIQYIKRKFSMVMTKGTPCISPLLI